MHSRMPTAPVLGLKPSRSVPIFHAFGRSGAGECGGSPSSRLPQASRNSVFFCAEYRGLSRLPQRHLCRSSTPRPPWEWQPPPPAPPPPPLPLPAWMAPRAMPPPVAKPTPPPTPSLKERERGGGRIGWSCFFLLAAGLLLWVGSKFWFVSAWLAVTKFLEWLLYSLD